MRRSQSNSQNIPVLNPNAAGIDIGSSFHVAALPPDRCEEPVKPLRHSQLI
ncbi:MAG: hypothetical protein KIT59_10120 [Nitrosomonas sp.]|nr:hypothetical protein [Nitrosomonas sp.]